MNKLRFKGTVEIAGIKTVHNRIYPKHVLLAQVNDLQDAVKNRRFIGQLGIPTTSLTDASHVVTELFMNGDKMVAEIEVLDTPKGRMLRNLIEADHPIVLQQHGVRIGQTYTNGVLIISGDYKITSICVGI